MRYISPLAKTYASCLVIAAALTASLWAWEHRPGDDRADEPPCLAPDEWFAATGTPAVPDTFAIASDDDECSFYKWAWQNFLRLNQSDTPGGAPRFILFKTFNDLFKTPSQLIAAVPTMDRGKRVLSLAIRTSPLTSRMVTTIATAQAGSHGVVVDKNGRAMKFRRLEPQLRRCATGHSASPAARI
jgi:hypothetical protein